MLKLQNRITRTQPEKPWIACELAEHLRGAFNINGKLFRPEWPIAGANRGQDVYDQAKDIIQLGVEVANKVYVNREGSPRRVRIELYEDGRKRIIVQE